MSINKKVLQGRIKRHADGYGFFIPDDTNEPDLYIAPNRMKHIMANDRVEARVLRKNGDRFYGEVLKVTERSITQVIGKIGFKAGRYFLNDDSHTWGTKLLIEESGLAKAKENEWVGVQITQYPTDRLELKGKVTEVLGEHLEPIHDIYKIIFEMGAPYEFPARVLSEAEGFSDEVLESDKKNRKDLRKTPLITIDGATAKDFDDAIFVEKTKGGFRAIVGIADVSHYVRPGSAIDDEAVERGTSIYFPGSVVPMLPEKLSNGLCSLNPHVDRLALCCEMHFNHKAEIQKVDLFEAVMQSHARVTYGQAQEVLEGNGDKKFQSVAPVIEVARDLALLLMKKRKERGSLEIDIPETVVEVDGRGEPVDILTSERVFTHKLIEELMLITNVSVARFLEKKKLPQMYRIHESPDELSFQNLSKFLEPFGFKKKIAAKSSQKSLNTIMQKFSKEKTSYVINMLVLQSLKQAKYSPERLGHYGLGFESYAHFTSPIRRYPDLITHRLVKSVIIGNPYKKLSQEDLEKLGDQCSQFEQRAVKCERKVVSIKKARFLEPHLGKSFNGFITKPVKFGLFVHLKDFSIDGLVKLDSLGKDRFNYYEDHLILRGQRSGYTYRIGDAVKIKIAQVDVITGKVDLELLEHTATKSDSDAKLGFKKPGSKKSGYKKSGSDRYKGSKKSKSSKYGSKKYGSKKQGSEDEDSESDSKKPYSGKAYSKFKRSESEDSDQGSGKKKSRGFSKKSGSKTSSSKASSPKKNSKSSKKTGNKFSIKTSSGQRSLKFGGKK